jgi:exosortase/archaeosortase family protein
LAASLFTPYIPHFTSFIATILRVIGMSATKSNPNTIVLHTANGQIQLLFVWACVGFISMYIFSIILVFLLFEEPSSVKTKVIWAIIGVLGTFVVNIIRIVTLVAGFYFYGYQYGETIHSYIGYILFVTWSLIFLYLFSKRNTILQKIRMPFVKGR